MLETFTFIPNTETSGQIKYRTNTAQFGDGYTQVAGDGINNRAQSWQLSFIECETQTLDIKAFLDRHAGIKPFLWSPPVGQQLAFYTPDGYALSPMGGDVFNITVTFVQFNLP